jgi:acyl-CoA synthetase (AMP-forming)/AMP-acid ligase II
MLPPFEPALLGQLGEILDKHRITFMSSVPSVWKIALKIARPPEYRTLERVCCGSAPLSTTVWQDIREWAGTKEVLNAYGITETGSWLAGTTVPDFAIEDGLIGVPWGSDIKILTSNSTETSPRAGQECGVGETGYIWVKTPALMRGYLDRDDLTSQVVSDGWFLTGDIGFLDEQGLLYLRGREREEINKGGAKIYPADIDVVLERFDGILDVCSFGYEDPLYGENVGVAIVLRSGEEETLRHLYDWARQHLAKHQLPLRWYIVEEIPRTSRGKINRALMAQRCAKRLPVDPRVFTS